MTRMRCCLKFHLLVKSPRRLMATLTRSLAQISLLNSSINSKFITGWSKMQPPMKHLPLQFRMRVGVLGLKLLLRLLLQWLCLRTC